MEKPLSFDYLPQAVNQLSEQVSELRELLVKHQISTTPSSQDSDKLLVIKEAADLLHLSIPTIYSKVSKGELPCMKRGKRLYFMREELIAYLKRGRKQSNAEIEAKPTESTGKRKGGRS